MRRPLHDGQTPRPLHENSTTNPWWAFFRCGRRSGFFTQRFKNYANPQGGQPTL